MTDEEFARLFPNATWPKTFESKRATRIIPPDPAKHIERFLASPITEDKIPPDNVGSLRNYMPTPRDRLADVLYGIYGSDPEGKHRVDNLMNYADFLGGTLFGAYDTPRALGEGRYKDAVLPGVTTFAPFAGKPLKMLAGAMKREDHYDDVVENFASSSRTPNAIAATGNGIKLTPATRQAQFTARPFGEQISQIRTIEAVEDALPQMPGSKPEGWDNIVFEEPGPGEFWARSSPWMVQYGPLRKPPREFALDYPDGGVADEAGNLLKDISGNDLVSKKIAGRRKKGEKDQGLTPDTIRSIIEDDFRVPILRVHKSELPGRSLGAVATRDGVPLWIKVWDRLPQDQTNVVLAHELGHIIDYATGRQSTRGLTQELDGIFSENISGQPNRMPLITPKSVGYQRDAYGRERMAEAIRTAIVNPNTIKTIAPKTAKFLREIINKHPIVSKILQVNGVPLGIPAVTAVTAITGGDNPSKAQVPARDPSGAYTSISAYPWNGSGNTRKLGSAHLATGVRPIPDRVLSSARDVSVRPGRKESKDLVRALIELNSRQNRQFYGGPR
jgi:hypothetical protein